MKLDMTITISVVIALCAIVSPVITTLLNNHHAYKLKKLEMRLEKQKSSSFYKRGVYEDYLKNAERCINNYCRETCSIYAESYALARIYFPDRLHKELVAIHEDIVKSDLDHASTLLNELIPKIRAIVQTM